MRLIDFARAGGRRKVVPLMGYPGARLIGRNLRQIGFNSMLHADAITSLHDRFRPDASFLIMDLSIEAGAVGIPVRYPLHESPSVEEHPVQTEEDLESFEGVDILGDARAMAFVRAMQMIRDRVPVAKGAYVIGPFSLAGLLMGASEAAMATVTDQHLLHRVLHFATALIRRYADALVEAGADCIAVLEPTAVMLSPRDFQQFSGQYVAQVFQGLQTMTVLHICGDSTHLVPVMCDTGAQGLSLDSAVALGEVVRTIPDDVVLIGNIDPVRVMCNMASAEVRHECRTLMASMEDYPNFIVSTGCDLPPETPFENISAMVDAVRE